MTIAPERRKRRRIAVVGFGVLAVAGVTAAAIVVSGGPSAGSAGSHQVADNLAHLRAVLPGLLPDAKDIKVTTRTAESPDVRMFDAEITFTDDDGPAMVTLTVSSAPGAYETVDEICGPHSKIGGTGPDGKPMRCTKTKQPGGDVLVVSEAGITSDIRSDDITDITNLDATDYRGGDHVVLIENDRFTTGVPNPGMRSSYPLDERQLTALATDKQLTLR